MTALPHADPELDRAYRAAGHWGDESLADVIARHATERPDAVAFVDERGDVMSWRDYHELSDRIAGTLVQLGFDRGDRIAVLFEDGPLVHAAFVGAEKAGLVVMGIGHRAGDAEIDHLVARWARALLTPVRHGDEPSAALFARLCAKHRSLSHHLVVTGPAARGAVAVTGPVRSLGTDERAAAIAQRHLGPSELFLLNSTSGTTGLPKCVMQTQNRWVYFHHAAATYGAFGPDEVVMSVVPAPFGFGLWTSHVTPTLLGAPCVVMSRFSPAGMIRLIEQHRVTVLCCVSTQFIMMLNAPELVGADVSSLRLMFTGGEAIPESRAREFEARTGCTVLNFYGSNETGFLSGTRVDDPPDLRLSTGGRIEPDMAVRLYTEEGTRIAGDRGRGIPACKGPALSLGYWDDPAANAQLFTDDGWVLMGDVVEIDDDGWLSVVGRTSDFIIRGGKNISAPTVEDEVSTHPAVSLAAVVAAPDPVFGERVAAFVEVHPGCTLDLEDLRAHLSARGVSKEWFPEYLFVLDDLPRASGGKVAKGELRAEAARRVG